MQITYYSEDSLNLDNILIGFNEFNQIVFVGLENTIEYNLIELKKLFPESTLVQGTLNDVVRHIFSYLKNPITNENFNIQFIGTPFQQLVWKEIQKLKAGETITYTELASNIGMPKSIRAVANACGKNNIAIIVPCHRVISKSGNDSGYKWGLIRKKNLFKIENNKSIY